MRRQWDDPLDFYSVQERVINSTLGFGRFAQSKMHGACHYQNNKFDQAFDPFARVYQTRLLVREIEDVMRAASWSGERDR